MLHPEQLFELRYTEDFLHEGKRGKEAKWVSVENLIELLISDNFACHALSLKGGKHEKAC